MFEGNVVLKKELNHFKGLGIGGNLDLVIPFKMNKVKPVTPVVVVKTHIKLALKYLMYFGTLIGVNFKYRYITLAFALNLWIFFGASIVDMMIGIINENKYRPSDLGWAIGHPIFYSIGLSIYLHFYYNLEKLKSIFTLWRESMNTAVDLNFQRYVNWISFVILTSAILENVTFVIQGHKLYIDFEGIPGVLSKLLQGHFETSVFKWIGLPYSTPLAAYMFISDKFCWYLWNFGDVFIICFCRGISFQIKQLNAHGKGLNAYHHLLEVVKPCLEFLSPLVFISVGANMYALCMQLHMALTPRRNKTMITRIYSVWSAVHLLTRVILVILAGIRVHDEGKSFLDGNSETRVPKPLVVSGYGLFRIKRRFIIQLIGTLFSVEVFLLTGDASP